MFMPNGHTKSPLGVGVSEWSCPVFPAFDLCVLRIESDAHNNSGFKDFNLPFVHKPNSQGTMEIPVQAAGV